MTSPREVLDQHTTLYERLKHPPAVVRDFYATFFTKESLLSLERDVAAGKGEWLNRWLQMLAPALNADEFLAMVGRPLYGAPTFAVTAPIVSAVTATYEATVGQGIRLQEEDVPFKTGFAWLDEPVVLTDAGGFSIATRALSWAPARIPDDFVRGAWPGEGFSREGVRLTSYSHVGDTDTLTDPAMARRLQQEAMPLSIAHSSFISYGTPFQARKNLAEDVTRDDIIHWVHTLWIFMGTEIVATARPQVERPARRRAARSIGSSEVNVVTLRRIRVAGAEVAQRDIDWSCQWVVQAHRRHLEDYSAVAAPHHAVPLDGDSGHCSVCRTRITRVRAYVKGPDGRPLKAVPETVYRVAR